MLLGIGSVTHQPGHHFAREPGFAHWTLAMLWRGHGRFTAATSTADLQPDDAVVPA